MQPDDTPRPEADAGHGGAGAPPDTNAANRVFSRLTREYETDAIRVQWYARRCIHSAACIRALPQVFDPRRRPWIDVDAAGADEIARAVVQCPTGALQFVRKDGGPGEEAPDVIQVVPVENGPYLLRGAVEVRSPEGDLIRSDRRMALCRCGQSKHMPFCDNTHREVGFRSGPANG